MSHICHIVQAIACPKAAWSCVPKHTGHSLYPLLWCQDEWLKCVIQWQGKPQLDGWWNQTHRSSPRWHIASYQEPDWTTGMGLVPPQWKQRGVWICNLEFGKWVRYSWLTFIKLMSWKFYAGHIGIQEMWQRPPQTIMKQVVFLVCRTSIMESVSTVSKN